MMKKAFTAVALALLLTFPLGSLVFGQGNTARIQDQPVILPANEIVNHDYYAVGSTVAILGTVNGDVYAAGGTVDIPGTVNGDIMAAGGNVTISGNVTQDIRIAGVNVTISGRVGRNITAAGGTITLTNTSTVAGSLTGFGGQVSLLGPVGKDLMLGAGRVTLNNTVGGDVNASLDTLTLSPDAKIQGNLTYQSENKATIAKEASIGGKITYHPTPKVSKAEADKKLAFGVLGIITWFKILSFLSTLLVGYLLMRLLPVYTQHIGKLILTRPWGSLGLGFVSLIVTPILFVILLITVIGIPLAFILLGAFFILMYLAKLFILMTIGKKIVNFVLADAGLFWGLLVGALIYELVTFITPLNFFISLLTYSIGLGALLIHKRELYESLRLKKVI